MAVTEIRAVLRDNPDAQYSTGISLALYTQLPVNAGMSSGMTNNELLQAMLTRLFRDGVHFTLRDVEPEVAVNVGEMQV